VAAPALSPAARGGRADLHHVLRSHRRIGWVVVPPLLGHVDVFSVFIDLLPVFFISLLLLTNRLRIRDFVLSLTHPDHQRRTGLVLDGTWLRMGGYLRAKVIVMAIVGALTYLR
jgi:predicted PurR-regulated permease PerM